MATRKRAASKAVSRRGGRALPGAGDGFVHTLKVSLQGVRPPIWRRILVPSDFTLAQLHDVLQEAMGWTNSHLHQFEVGDMLYSDPTFELEEVDLDMEDESSITVAEALPRQGSWAVYEYDFGDGWKHLLLVEKVGPPEPDLLAPVCLKGARACPPEDCGGPSGYAQLLEALREPKQARHRELLEWLGSEFDPEPFDLESVNRALRGLR